MWIGGKILRHPKWIAPCLLKCVKFHNQNVDLANFVLLSCSCQYAHAAIGNERCSSVDRCVSYYRVFISATLVSY